MASISTQDWNRLWNEGHAEAAQKAKTTTTQALQNRVSALRVSIAGDYDSHPHASGQLVAIVDVLSKRGAI